MRKVIIVDDEKPAIELIEYIINSYNIPVEVIDTCENGIKAFESININLPDIVFIDIEMPGMNGLEVIEKVSKSNIKKIEFIIITAYDKFEYAQKALRLGARDILLKPIDIESFLKIIDETLEYKLTDNSLLNDILKSINKRYKEDISLQKVAEDFSTSSSYIAKLFNKYLDISFINYVNNKRINASIKLLLETEENIKSVASEVGFNNLNHFYTTFKRVTKTTPREYRDRFK